MKARQVSGSKLQRRRGEVSSPWGGALAHFAPKTVGASASGGRPGWGGALAFGAVLAALAIGLLYLLLGPQPKVEDVSLQRIQQAGEIVVGIDPSYPPFESLDAEGNLIGYDVDLAVELARRLGVRASFVSLDIGSIHDALLANKLDVIVSSLPPFPEYTRQIAYSLPYFNAGQVLVLGPHSGDLDGVGDLSGRALGVESGSTADLEMRKLAATVPDLSIVSFTTPDAALADLRVGKLDAVVADAVTALEWRARSGGLRIVPEPLTVEPFVVALRRADALLLQEVDRVLAEVEQDGTQTALHVRWLEASGE
ncbi:MAG: amino acid ABC transporter substrate-binding protein [Chloroflexi bacterium]|nr:amino acid ABC transporter substrate-binding protein [Chloroflexota bacterium]